MNENTPMTPAQQLFAEEHHNLVYAFLNEKKDVYKRQRIESTPKATEKER